MIRVTIELFSAVTGATSVLGIAEIANDGVRSRATAGALGDYSVRLSKWAPKENQTWKYGRVEGFDRIKRGPWDLLYLALHDAIGGKRNPLPEATR